MNMDSRIELTTARLLLKPITPAVIHTLFNAKTKEEIIHFFNVDEAGYDHLKNMHEKGHGDLSDFTTFLFDLVIKKQIKLSVNAAIIRGIHRTTALNYFMV
jgi:hypothetical protein